MQNGILPALMPSAEQAMNAWIVTGLVLGIFVAFVAVWWICDYGIDRAIRRWRRRHQEPVVDLAERRRLNAVLAIWEDRR